MLMPAKFLFWLICRQTGYSLYPVFLFTLFIHHQNQKYMNKQTEYLIKVYLRNVNFHSTAIGMAIGIAMENCTDEMFRQLIIWLKKEIDGNELLVSTIIGPVCTDLIKRYSLNKNEHACTH
jgi:hypothetical protein